MQGREYADEEQCFFRTKSRKPKGSAASLINKTLQAV
jgi:hypothetical protein